MMIGIARTIGLNWGIEQVTPDGAVLLLEGIPVEVPNNPDIPTAIIVQGKRIKHEYAEDAVRFFCAPCL